jgi:DNA-binding beta-propeller fold protein YncE
VVPTGAKKADLLDYGADRHRLYVSNSTDGTITSIDPASGAIKAHFTVGYTLEQPRYDPADGKVYVTSPDANALFRIDPNDGTVTKIPLGGSCQPTGMAINPKTNMALIACTSFVVSWDLRTGAAVTFPQVAGGDVISYDARADRFFVASPKMARVGIFGGSPIDFISSVATGSQSNSAAYDETNDAVYLPDSRPNTPGWLTSLTGAAPYAAVLAVFVVLIFFLVGRSADPVRRRTAVPASAPKGAAGRGV